MAESDPVLESLMALQASLLRGAEKAGEGPTGRRKSDFKTERERTSFIGAWGVEAYNKLPD